MVNTENQDIAISAGEVLVMRGSDGYPVNLIQSTRDWNVDQLRQSSKIVGNFLVIEIEDNDEERSENVSFVRDPNWEGGSQPFKDAVRDKDGKIVTIDYLESLTDG